MFKTVRFGLLKPRLFGKSWIRNNKPIAESVLPQHGRSYAKINRKFGHTFDEPSEGKDESGNQIESLFRDNHNDPFFFPNKVALAYSCKHTTFTPYSAVREIACKSKGPYIQMEALRCPLLMEKYVQELFPITAKVDFTSNPINIVNIKYNDPRNSEIYDTLQHFILMAREISVSVHSLYWADFINPVSGRPFFMDNVKAEDYSVDERFRGINVSFSQTDGCVIMQQNTKNTFAGSIFTTAPLQVFSGQI